MDETLDLDLDVADLPEPSDDQPISELDGATAARLDLCGYCESPDHGWADCEARRVLACVSRWVQVALSDGYQHAIDGGGDSGAWSNLPVEIEHSALLRRLIRGQEPLDLAPPRANSYPWYNLYETGTGNVSEMAIPREPIGSKENPIILDQGVWSILEMHEDGTRVVQWLPGHPRFLLQRHPQPPHPFIRYQLVRLPD